MGAQLEHVAAQVAEGQQQRQQANARERELLRGQQELHNQAAAQQPAAAVAAQLEQLTAQLATSQLQLQQAEAQLDDAACAICLTAPRSASVLPCMHR